MCVCMLLHAFVYKIYSVHVSTDSFVQAEYWHDPLHESVYQENCVFLPDLNQEVVSAECGCTRVGWIHEKWGGALFAGTGWYAIRYRAGRQNQA